VTFRSRSDIDAARDAVPVSLLDDIEDWVPWLVEPLAATALRLLIASVQLAAVAVGER
jgi:hypothetical protein